MNEFFTSKPSIVSSDRVLYTPSAFARSSLLHLQEVGELRALQPHISKRSGLQSYLFFVVIDGEGQLIYGDKNYLLTPGSCVFIDCKKTYSHSTDQNLWTISWCHFYGPSLSSVYDKYCERGGRPAFTPDSIDPYSAVLQALIAVGKSGDYLRDMRINALISTLLLEIMKESWHPEEKKAAPKRQSVVAVKDYLEKHYAESISLNRLSSLFFIDKYYLAKTFKNQFGLTISAYTQNIRITKAKQLLRFSEKTVEEIGHEVGMYDPAYFSRVFKNVEGVSPKTYREQW